ncbi:acriflavin resistance protein [Bacterioplanes sanyensis]|uniref:efflux RND transporter permease subunit n=1 Tax=Bacterioplanes sanyensis TaxID=1249553 RepID=UPI001679B319|nr:efflux RND transporter permease subunit [Bacterioplanes sanyensis]GGY41879.1 acriflavin resistance protein [Bacterioplanes sanyensis]
MTTDTHQGVIAWFARNPVAANLLMVFILVGGMFSAFTIQKQMFPQLEFNWISISTAYPGAGPQDVEDGITEKIEQSLEGIQGIKRVITYSMRNASQTWVEVDDSYDVDDVLDEVKVNVEGIQTMPSGAETPLITREKFIQEVMWVALHGELPFADIRKLGEDIYDEIRQLPRVQVSEFHGGPAYEISIEVSRDRLREYDLTFAQVAASIRAYSANMSAGEIRTDGGYIGIRVENQAYQQREFEQIPIRTLADGSQLRLADVAQVHDGFEQGLQYNKFNGHDAVLFFVGASNDQSTPDVAAAVKEYIEQRQASLPAGMTLEPWIDLTYYLEGRLDMMLSNMWASALLVFLMLSMFLRLRLAAWVMVGLPVCFLGTLMMMPMDPINVTISLTSLFGFILVLGIVVDDAIVIGESVYSEVEQRGQSMDSVIAGAKKVAMPATFGVLTTVAAFLPMLIGDGPDAAIAASIGWVVILCLLFSLVESKLILPAHLAGMAPKKDSRNPIYRLQDWIDARLQAFIQHSYGPFLRRTLAHRYSVVALFIAVLFITIGLVQGGVVRMIGMPKVPHDFPEIQLEMTSDSGEQATLDAALAIERMIREVDRQIEEESGRSMISSIYVELDSRTEAEIMTTLVEPELRPMDTFALAERWREAMPAIPGLKSLSIQEDVFGGGREDGDISFKLFGSNHEQLAAAAAELKQKLERIEGVGDINDSQQSTRQEVGLRLTPLGQSLGLDLASVAGQMNASFYGLEVQRILRDGEEVKVMLRYPQTERNALGHVADTRIQTPTGASVPLAQVAELEVTRSAESIRREDGARTLTVWASVNSAVVEPQKVAQDIRDNFLPELLQRYDGVRSELSGRIQDEIDSQTEQLRNFALSMLLVYALLAIPLRSYGQPLVIMAVIPFGVIGAIYGHLLLGMGISSFSLFGIIAAAGVVVNDSLVMVDYINQQRRAGIGVKEAVLAAGQRRFRAIMLTSLTTFIGLMPIMLETSLQAKIVIPMAVSLAFGVLFATVITLLLIPNLYLVGADLSALGRRMRGKPARIATEQ